MLPRSTRGQSGIRVGSASAEFIEFCKSRGPEARFGPRNDDKTAEKSLKAPHEVGEPEVSE